MGIRLGSTLYPKEEGPQSPPLTQKAWMLTLLLQADLPLEAARNWPMQDEDSSSQALLDSGDQRSLEFCVLRPPDVFTDLGRDRASLKESCVTATCCEPRSLEFCALRPPDVSTDLGRDRASLKGSCVTATCCESQSL